MHDIYYVRCDAMTSSCISHVSGSTDSYYDAMIFLAIFAGDDLISVETFEDRVSKKINYPKSTD